MVFGPENTHPIFFHMEAVCHISWKKTLLSTQTRDKSRPAKSLQSNSPRGSPSNAYKDAERVDSDFA